jgi:hypothetical protein
MHVGLRCAGCSELFMRGGHGRCTESPNVERRGGLQALPCRGLFCFLVQVSYL